MYKMNDVEIQELKLEYDAINDKVIMYEDDLNEFRTGELRFISLDDIHLLEEQLHYMRGYLRLVKIRLNQQGIKV